MTRPFVVATIGLTVTISFLVGLIVAGSLSPTPAHSATPPEPREFSVPAQVLPIAGAALGATSFADVAEHLNPTVVNIDATSRGAFYARRRYSAPLPERPELFGRQPDREDDGREGVGTGFVFDPSGLILTNQHVIDGAERVMVRLADGRNVRAAVVGADPETDIAVLKVDAGAPLPAAPLGDSDRLRVGEWVCAIGNPLAYEHSVTVGVVSFIGRKLFDASLERYIQTDAAINLGNSGGPLINARGEVVGINAAVSARGANIGFAVPINKAREILPALMAAGRVSRGYLGVTVRSIDEDLRRSLALASARGVLVQNVVSGSPAARAGLRAYDVIVGVDGEQATTNDALHGAMAARRPGTQVTLHLIRDGRPVSLLAKLAERPIVGRKEEPVRTAPPALTMRGPNLGLLVWELDREFRMRYRVPDDAPGVVVFRVEPLSPGSDAQIDRGHVILEINRRTIRSVDDFRREVADTNPGDVLAFYLFNPGRQQHEFRTVRVDN